MDAKPVFLKLKEGRFSRFESIDWWKQERLKEARVLVVGAGALGNEVLKNFALLGLENIAIIDMDHVEKSNLSRSILFRELDEGLPKAECAAKAMKAICPDVKPHPLVGNLLSDIGLGYFRWAEVVVGALDNREARVFVNSACALVGRPWVDGGIDVLQGIVRVFNPPQTACYECTMSQKDWDQINQRRSCSLIARKAFEHRGTATTPTTASVIGGIQSQEVIKMLHGLKTLHGEGYFFDGISHSSYLINHPINPECDWHEPSPDIETFEHFNSDTPLKIIAQYAVRKFGGLDAIDLSRELIRELKCPSCGQAEAVWMSIEKTDERQALCKNCGAETVPDFFHSIAGDDSALLDKSLRQLGLPLWDIVWVRYKNAHLGIEISGDNPFINPK